MRLSLLFLVGFALLSHLPFSACLSASLSPPTTTLNPGQAVAVKIATSGTATGDSCTPVITMTGVPVQGTDYTVDKTVFIPEVANHGKATLFTLTAASSGAAGAITVTLAFGSTLDTGKCTVGTATITVTLVGGSPVSGSTPTPTATPSTAATPTPTASGSPAPTSGNITASSPAATTGPVITAVAPARVSYASSGSTTITVFGDQFPKVMSGISTIKILGTSCNSPVFNGTAIQCSLPRQQFFFGLGVVDVVFANPTSNSSFPIALNGPVPRIDTVQPPSMPGSTSTDFSITVSGGNFYNTPFTVQLGSNTTGYIACFNATSCNKCTSFSFMCPAPPLNFIGPPLSFKVTDGSDQTFSASQVKSVDKFSFVTTNCSTPCMGNTICAASGNCVCLPGFTGGAAAGCPQVSYNIDIRELSKGTSENGGSFIVPINLLDAPTASVVISPISVFPTTEAQVNPSTLTFRSSDYSVPQTLTITGVSDAVRDGTQLVLLRFAPLTSKDPAYNGVIFPEFPFNNVDKAPIVTKVYPDTVPLAGHSPTQNMTIVGEHFDPDVIALAVEGAKNPVTVLLVVPGVDLLAASSSTPVLHMQQYAALEQNGTLNSSSSFSSLVSRSRHALQLPDTVSSVVVQLGAHDTGYATLVVTGRDGLTGSTSNMVFYTDVCPSPKGLPMWGSGSDCKECPKGAICPGGKRMWPLPGYWLPSEDSADIFQCADTTRCPGVSAQKCGSSWCPLNVSVSACGSSAYTGERCASCSRHYFPAGGKCEKCSSALQNIAFVIADTCNWLVVAAAVAILETKDNVGLVISFSLSVQTINGVGKLLSPFFPPWCKFIYRFFGLFGGDITFLNPTCAPFPFPFHALFFGQIGYSLTLPSSLIVGLLIARALAKRKYQNNPLRLQERMLHYKFRMRRALTIILTMIYLPVTTICMKALFCKNVGGGRWTLQADPSYRCFQGLHILCMIVAMLILLGFTLGFPIMYGWFIVKNEALRFTDALFRAQFDFNYEPYKHKYWYLYLSEFVIGLGLALGDSKLDPNKGGSSIGQFVVVGFVFFAHLVLIVALRPHDRQWENGMMAAMSGANLVGVIILFLFTKHALGTGAASIVAALLMSILLTTIFVNLAALGYYVLYIQTHDEEKFPILKELEIAKINNSNQELSEETIKVQFSLAKRRQSFAVARDQGLENPYEAVTAVLSKDEKVETEEKEKDRSFVESMWNAMISVFSWDDTNNNNNNNNSPKDGQNVGQIEENSIKEENIEITPSS